MELLSEGASAKKSSNRFKVKTSAIKVPENRGRKDFSHVPELASSIAQYGLMHPIVVNDNKDGTYTLIAGESRLRACQLIPLAEVDCTLFTNLSPVEQREMELEENIRRKELVWSERINILKELHELKQKTHGDAVSGDSNEGWSVKDTANISGMSPASVSSQIAFARRLAERPDLKEELKNLPLTAAMRVFDQKMEAERHQRMVDAGTITIDSSLVNMDCIVFARSLSDNSIDLIVTDPPFGMDSLADVQGEDRSDDTVYTQQLKPTDNLTADSALDLFTRLAPEMFRVLKPGSFAYVFSACQSAGPFSTALKNAGFEVQFPWIIWDKGRTTSIFRGYSFMSCYEMIILAQKPGIDGKRRRLSTASKAIVTIPPVGKTTRLHPFEKPHQLLEMLIKSATNVGDTVCDFFAGSGSVVATSRLITRKGIGCEIDKEHFTHAQVRLLRIIAEEK